MALTGPLLRRATGWAFRSLVFITPKRKQLLVRTFPDFDDTMRAIANECSARSLRLVVLVDDPSKRPCWLDHRAVALRAHSVRALLEYIRSSHVMFTHGLYGSPRPSRRHVVINVWHGMPLKKIELDLGRSWTPGFTYTIATSEPFRQIVARSFGVTKESVLMCGHPRIDVLQASTDKAQPLRECVVWLPTYRNSAVGAEHRDGSTVLGIPSEDLVARIREILDGNGIDLIVKLHPMAEPREARAFKDGGATVVTDESLAAEGETLYSLLGRTSILITDYSSVAVDFLVTRRPILIAVGDAEEYSNSRGLNFGLDQLGHLGTVVTSLETLPSALEEAVRSRPAPDPMAFDLYYSVGRSNTTGQLFDTVGL